MKQYSKEEMIGFGAFILKMSSQSIAKRISLQPLVEGTEKGLSTTLLSDWEEIVNKLKAKGKNSDIIFDL